MANILAVPVYLYIFVLIISYNACIELKEQNTFSSYKVHNPSSSSVQIDESSVHDSDLYTTTVDLITRSGYPVETHTVITEDGYLLTVHRIPGSPKAASSGSKGPVLVQHGVFAASDTFVFENGLGFPLADQGYDVWLGNSRGNYYSRRHVTLSPEEPKFWDFSWHEMGVYDLPAVIDHILKVTNQPRLFYIGHSMGTTTFFVMSSLRPEYNQKIKLMVALAPIAYLAKSRLETYKILSNFYSPFDKLFRFAGFHELFPRQRYIQGLVGSACREGNPLLKFCLAGLSAAFGLNRDSFNKTAAPVVFSHLLAGSSEKTIVHYAQVIYADRFQIYDSTGIMGTKTPEYNLRKVTAPVVLMYAENDLLATPEATKQLRRSLPNVVKMFRLPDKKAGHLDFVLSINAKTQVYSLILAILNSIR